MVYAFTKKSYCNTVHFLDIVGNNGIPVIFKDVLNSLQTISDPPCSPEDPSHSNEQEKFKKYVKSVFNSLIKVTEKLQNILYAKKIDKTVDSSLCKQTELLSSAMSKFAYLFNLSPLKVDELWIAV